MATSTNHLKPITLWCFLDAQVHHASTTAPTFESLPQHIQQVSRRLFSERMRGAGVVIVRGRVLAYHRRMSRSLRFIVSRFLSLTLLVAALGAGPAHAEDTISIHVLDVGEGLSILIESPKGESILIDAGNPSSVGNIRAALDGRGIRALNHLVLTHPHLDHIGGFFALSALFPVRTLWDNGQGISQESAQNDMYRWFDDQRRAHERYRVARQGTKIVSEPFQLSVLSPQAGELDTDWNKNSLVLDLRYGSFRALFMGDATTDTEAGLLRDKLLEPISVLQVGHHGSRFASSEPFVAAVKPKLSVISANKSNIRGYPALETIERLRQHGKVLVTAEQGTVSIAAKRDGTFSWSSTRAD